MTKIKLIVADIRHDGFRSAIRKHGWKVGALIFGYYLVRDVTLYVLLPAMLAAITHHISN